MRAARGLVLVFTCIGILFHNQLRMADINFDAILNPATWYASGRGPRYQQLYRHLKDTLTGERVDAGIQLPPERKMAEQAEVSRVTIRKAVARLADDGMLDRQQGSGSFVRAKSEPKLKSSLSSLASFTELMEMRGYGSWSRVLATGLHMPSPTEMVALGLTGGSKVARVKRLRIADPGALAIETSTLPVDILPEPRDVTTSLYAVLRRNGVAPVRAIQRIGACNVSQADAQMLAIPAGSAVLQIARTAYLKNDRPIEFTCGIYRSDIYDFVAELKLGDGG